MKCCVTVCFVILLGLAVTQAVPAEPATQPSVSSTETKKPVNKEVKKPEIITENPAIAVEQVEESKQVDRAKKSAPAIEVEGIEESKQVDRTKKSASTTFCVEIRPGPSAEPVKVCEDEPAPAAPPAPVPQLPQEPHEIHEHPPAPSPTYIHNSEVQFIPISPNPAEVFISNEPCDPQSLPPRSFLHFPHLFQHHRPSPPSPPPQQHIIIPSVPFPPQQHIVIPSVPSPPQQHIIIPSVPSPPQQHIINPSVPSPPQQNIIIPSVVPNPWPQIPPHQHIPIPAPAPAPYPQTPCPPSPCASTGGSAPHPHAVLSLYRSAMDGPLSSLDGMQMRSNGNDVSGMFPGFMIPSGMEYGQNVGSEIVGTTFGRPPLRVYGSRRPLPLPYPSSLNNRRYPTYIGRCNQESSLGRSADGSLNDLDTNGQTLSAMKSSWPPFIFPRASDGVMMETSPQLNEERWNSNNGLNRNMNIPLGDQTLMMSGSRSTIPEKNVDMDGNHSLMLNEMGKREAKE